MFPRGVMKVGEPRQRRSKICSVFGLGIRTRWFFQSTSPHFSDSDSLGVRTPPNRARANSNRHSAFGQASKTFVAISRVMKWKRFGFELLQNQSHVACVIGARFVIVRQDDYVLTRERAPIGLARTLCPMSRRSGGQADRSRRIRRLLSLANVYAGGILKFGKSVQRPRLTSVQNLVTHSRAKPEGEHKAVDSPDLQVQESRRRQAADFPRSSPWGPANAALLPITRPGVYQV